MSIVSPKESDVREGISMVTKTLKLIYSKDEAALVIPLTDWVTLKARVTALARSDSVFQTIGLILISIAGSSFVAAVTITSATASWITLVTAGPGVVALFAARRFRNESQDPFTMIEGKLGLKHDRNSKKILNLN